MYIVILISASLGDNILLKSEGMISVFYHLKYYLLSSLMFEQALPHPQLIMTTLIERVMLQ